MPTDAEYRDKITAMDRDQLFDFWKAIESLNTPGWEPGKAFEYCVLRAFELEGGEVTWPYSVKLDEQEVEQIDGVISLGGLFCLVESKQRQPLVNIESIAKLRNQLARRPAAAIGVVFSYSGFTEPARVLARYLAPQTILLWEGGEVRYALHHQLMAYGLRMKFKYAVEHGLPDYNLLEE